MANKITFEEFKNILDYIEQRQPDNYSSLYLYVNEYINNAKVFKHRVDEEEIRTIADAVVIQQSVQLVDSEHRYELPVIRDSLWATSQGKEPKDPVKVYDAMLSGYTNAEKVLYTICRAYGVILDENFKYIDTVEYNNLLRIIAGFYTDLEDVSVQPFGAKKYSSTEYLSYYPAYIIYQVGKYLSNLGVFEKSENNFQPYIRYDVPCNDVPTFTESQFRTNVLNKAISLNRDYVGEKLEGGFNLISGLLDFNKIILGVFNVQTSYTLLTFYEFPKNVKFGYRYAGGNFRFVTPYRRADGTPYGKTIYFSFNENSSYSIYTVNYNYSTNTYSYNKNVVEITDTDYHSETPGSSLPYSELSNINYLRLPVYYMYNYSTWADGGNHYKAYFSLGNMPGSTVGYQTYFDGNLTNCNVSEVNKLNSVEFRKITTLANKELDLIFNEYNIEFSSDDLVLAYSAVPTTPIGNIINYTKLFILKGLNVINESVDTTITDVKSVPTLSNFDSFITLLTKSTSLNSMIRTDIYLNVSANSSKRCWKITSNTPFDVYEYEIHPDGTFMHQIVGNTKSYIPALDNTYLDKNFYDYNLSNLGRLVEPREKPDWYELETDAVLPDAISTIEDFKATYPGWVEKSFRSHVPYYTGDFDAEVLTGIATFDWIPLSMAVNINSQAEAQAGLIDVDNYEVILEKIEKTEEDVDESETKNKPKTNIGDTPNIPGLGDLISVIGNGGMNQYYLNATQLGDIFESLFSLTPTTVVQNLFGNPLDFIVSLQLTYLNPVTGNAEPVKVGPYTLKTDDVEHVPHPVSALTVSEEYISVDCGSVDLTPYFETYLDYTASSCQLFLPFVGFVSVDFSEFIKGKMHIKAIADTLTGLIVYFIICEKDGTTQTLYQFNGNCQQQIPLNGANMGRFMGDVLKGVASYAMSDSPIPSLNLPQINVSRSGSMEANIGIMTQKTPYLIIKRNAEYNANKLETLTGFPSNNYIKLANCTGYQKIKAVHTSGINATQEEKDMIESILKSGVIV